MVFVVPPLTITLPAFKLLPVTVPPAVTLAVVVTFLAFTSPEALMFLAVMVPLVPSTVILSFPVPNSTLSFNLISNLA